MCAINHVTQCSRTRTHKALASYCPWKAWKGVQLNSLGTIRFYRQGWFWNMQTRAEANAGPGTRTRTRDRTRSKSYRWIAKAVNERRHPFGGLFFFFWFFRFFGFLVFGFWFLVFHSIDCCKCKKTAAIILGSRLHPIICRIVAAVVGKSSTFAKTA